MADENAWREAGLSPGRDVGVGRDTGVAVYQTSAYQPVLRPGLLRRVSWGAIFAGAVVAISCQLVLSTLGLAIGMATVNPATEQNPAEGLGVGAGIWWVVTGLISLFVGGWVAGRLAAFPRWIDAMLQGLVVWGLTAVASLWMLTTGLGTVMGGAMGALKDTAVATASNPEVARQASERGREPGGLVDQAQQALSSIQQEAQRMVAGDQRGGTGDPQVDRTIAQLLNKQPVTEQDRRAAVDLLVNRANMERDEAEDTVRRWEQSYATASRGGRQGDLYASPEPQAEAKARQAGQQVADTVTNAALWSFFALLLGAIAAAWGGALGRPAVSGAPDERVSPPNR